MPKCLTDVRTQYEMFTSKTSPTPKFSNTKQLSVAWHAVPRPCGSHLVWSLPMIVDGFLQTQRATGDWPDRNTALGSLVKQRARHWPVGEGTAIQIFKKAKLQWQQMSPGTCNGKEPQQSL